MYFFAVQLSSFSIFSSSFSRETGNQFWPADEDISGVCPEAAAEAALAVTGQQ